MPCPTSREQPLAIAYDLHMSATRILIVDDEAPARARLRRIVEELEGCEVVGEAGNGREALRHSESMQPDVLLLDIRMPDMDGIETARHLSRLEAPPAVIFTTAYDSYAIDAFDAEAVGYLLKPVRRERLVRALRQAARLGRTQLTALARSGPQPAARGSICVRKASGLQLIAIDEISYFEADQKYVTVHHRGGQDLLDEPLKDLASEFDDRFIRIHRSILVAAAHLDRLERNESGHYEVWLKNVDRALPVSRRHVTDVKLALRKPPA